MKGSKIAVVSVLAFLTFVVIGCQSNSTGSVSLTDNCKEDYGTALALVKGRIKSLYGEAAWVSDGYGVMVDNNRTYQFLIHAFGEPCIILVSCGEIIATACSPNKYSEFKALILENQQAGLLFDSHSEYMKRGSSRNAEAKKSQPSTTEPPPTDTPTLVANDAVASDGIVGHWGSSNAECAQDGGIWIERSGDEVKMHGWEWSASAPSLQTNGTAYSGEWTITSEGEVSTITGEMKLDGPLLRFSGPIKDFCCSEDDFLLRCPQEASQ